MRRKSWKGKGKKQSQNFVVGEYRYRISLLVIPVVYLGNADLRPPATQQHFPLILIAVILPASLIWSTIASVARLLDTKITGLRLCICIFAMNSCY